LAINILSAPLVFLFFFFSSRRRHTRWPRDWSSDVCSSDLVPRAARHEERRDAARPLRLAAPRPDDEDAGAIAGGDPLLGPGQARSEERRVGKEGRSRWGA